MLKFLDFRWLTTGRYERELEPWSPWKESQYLAAMSDTIRSPTVMRQPIEDIQYRGLSRMGKAAELERRFAGIQSPTSTDTIAERSFRDITHHNIAEAKPSTLFSTGLSQLLCISEGYLTTSLQNISATDLIGGPELRTLLPTESYISMNRSRCSSTTSGSSKSQTSTTSTSPTRECFTSFNNDVEDTAEECSREYFCDALSMPAEIDHIVERKDEHLLEYEALCTLSRGKARVAPQLLDHVTVNGPTFQKDHGHHIFEFPGVLLEHLPGRTLRDLLQEKVEITDLLAIQRAIVKAAHTLYEHGMYYADYHGGNIIMDLITDYPSPRYHAYIIDYGRWRKPSAETEEDPEIAIIEMIMNDYTGSDATAARELLEDRITGRFADYTFAPSIHVAWHLIMTKLVWGPVIEAGSMDVSSWEIQYERSGFLCHIMAEEFMDRCGADDDEKTLNWIREVVDKIHSRFAVTEAEVMTWFFKAREGMLNHETPLTPPYEAAALSRNLCSGQTSEDGSEEVVQQVWSSTASTMSARGDDD